MKINANSNSKTNHWQAVIQRNPQFDGVFVYGVKTTGIYCRPVCSSRLPNQENVQFFDTWKMAEKAGFRPCKRCKPQNTNAPNYALDAVTWACKMIEEAETEPSLKQLSDAVGFNPHYFHRLFKRIVGITPKQYAVEKRLDRLRTNLQEDSTITEAIYNAGYESSSRFYENATTSLGMKPTEYRNGGSGINIHYSVTQSYLGWVLVALTDRGICRIDIDDSPEILQSRLISSFPEAKLLADDPTITSIISQTLEFLEAPKDGLDLPLDIQGTAFQRRVWAALQDINPGTTASYSEIAEMIGNPKAARAVAQACASNNLAVAIPCHRAVRKNGDLGGYRWGSERKQFLLEMESKKNF
jgi:AraC family transcriptional regulator of adaptative response/methylated-DNA-[protein]-cysteine methyltransferase